MPTLTGANLDPEILSPGALEFVAELSRVFAPQVSQLLAERADRQERIDAGAQLDFLPDTTHIRRAAWTVAPVPSDLADRRVEITGPTDPKDGDQRAQLWSAVFMADFEDANTPTWDNMVRGPADTARSPARHADLRRR